MSALIYKHKKVTLYTPNGSAVEAFFRSEMSQNDISHYTNIYKNAYPQADVLANASSTYNCHSYAWNLSEGGSIICWLNQQPDLHKYWNDNSYIETTVSNAEKIFYYLGDHSAITSSVSGKYESKWGKMPLMRHAPEYGPTIYKMSYRKYYRKAPKISGSNLICSQSTYTIENLPAGATVEWSVSNGNLQLISGQGTPNATFKENGNGECMIKAKIAGVELTKTVWAGTISMIDFGTVSSAGEGKLCKEIPNELCVEESVLDASAQGVEEYEWKVSDESWHIIEHPEGVEGIGHGKNYVVLLQGSPYSGSSVYISVRARNTCGWGDWSMGKLFFVESCQDGHAFNFFLSPNGDGINDTWEFSASSDSKVEQDTFGSTSVSEVPAYNVTIFNSQGAIVYQKEKYMQDSERFSGVGNVGSYRNVILPNGDYFFMITGSEVKSGNIYIKR